MIRESVGKIDGMASCLGVPQYTEDFVPADAFQLKLVKSPYASAYIEEIDTEKALQIPDVICILSYEDIPVGKPITLAAEADPEGSTHDRHILERKLRFTGEPAAVIVARTKEAAEKGEKALRISYREGNYQTDYRKATDHSAILYQKGESFVHHDNGHEAARNLISQKCRAYGDVEAALAESAVVEDLTVSTPAQAHVPAETHRSYGYLDERGRIVIVTSCQSVFHTQRIIAEGLGIAAHNLRVIKAKVGGAFGGKNTSFFEGIVALAVKKTGHSCVLVTSREESMSLTNTRHAAQTRVRLGAFKDGTFSALDIEMLINGGAHGEHSFDVLNVGGANTMPIYRKMKAEHFSGKAVYTNITPAGAFRGFGAPQVVFGLEGAVSDLAWHLGMDPSLLRLKNIIHEGETHPFLPGCVVTSSRLEKLILRGKELIGWDTEYPAHRINRHTIQAVGMAIAMHGSGIAKLDAASAAISFNYDGSFTLFTGACDLGTGSDTILLQIAANTLGVPMERIQIERADTKTTPYDKGAYASSTTYVTGNAVKNACKKMRSLIETAVKKKYQVTNEIYISDECLMNSEGTRLDTLEDFAHKRAGYEGGDQLTCVGSFQCPIAPPPYIAGFVKLQVDTEVGKIKLLEFVAVVDCGTVINPMLAKVQVEGGIAQCIGFTLYENMMFSNSGKMITDDLQKYRIPCSMDIPPIRVEFIQSYERSGPYGAKSIGEVTFHTPAPAIREALLHATGCRFNTLPITPEKVLQALSKKKQDGENLPC